MTHPDLFGVRLLIFDMDGTLIRSDSVSRIAVRSALDDFYRERGAKAPEKSDEELLAGLGKPSEEFYRSLLPEKDRADWKRFRSLTAEKERHFLENKRITFPGIKRVLSELGRRGYRLALVSNCDRRYLDTVMETQNLGKFFEIITCVPDDGNANKADLVAEIKAEVELPAALIGDRKYDVEAAKRNGIPAVGVLYGYGSREELAGTSTWIERPGDLLYLFDPLRELAETVALEIRDGRSNERPFVVGISAPHEAVSAMFAPRLLTSLTDLNIPVVHLLTERHRSKSASKAASDGEARFESSFPWETLSRGITEGKERGRIEIELSVSVDNGAARSRIYRARAGQVLMVEGPYLFHGSLTGLFDLRIFLKAGDGTVRRAIRTVCAAASSGGVEGDLLARLYPFATGDVSAQHEEWEGVERRFFRKYMKSRDPRENGDILINGDKLRRGEMLFPPRRVE